jgi:phage terminase Nu1 subunit (DNA packaging protein)
MNTNERGRAMVEVTQADRALAELTRRGKGGKYDRDVGELAFLIARHREAALTTAQAEAEALKQRIAVLEKVIREVGRKAWCNPDSLTCQEIEALVVPLLSENGNG